MNSTPELARVVPPDLTLKVSRLTLRVASLTMAGSIFCSSSSSWEMMVRSVEAKNSLM